MNRRNRFGKSAATLPHRHKNNKRAYPLVFGGQRTEGNRLRRCTVSRRAREGDGEEIDCAATTAPNRARRVERGARRARPSGTWRSRPEIAGDGARFCGEHEKEMGKGYTPPLSPPNLSYQWMMELAARIPWIFGGHRRRKLPATGDIREQRPRTGATEELGLAGEW